MRKKVFFFILMIVPQIIYSQEEGSNEWLSLIQEKLDTAEHDTTRALVMTEFANYYKLKRPDSAIIYGNKAIRTSREHSFPKGEVKATQYLAVAYNYLGNTIKAFELCLRGILLSQKYGLINEENFFKMVEGSIDVRTNNYRKALDNFIELSKIDHSPYVTNYIGECYLGLNMTDSAWFYSQKAYDTVFGQDSIRYGWVQNPVLMTLGKIQHENGNMDQAIIYFKRSLNRALESINTFESNYYIAQLYRETGLLDSALHYAHQSLQNAFDNEFYQNIISANVLLSSIYEENDLTKALFHSKQAISYNDSLNRLILSSSAETLLDFNEQERIIELERVQKELQDRIRRNIYFGSVFTLVVVLFLLSVIIRRKQKAKQEIESAFDQLKSTQSQLVQSEKMASLGELTAGIAHEIQNPLNFVNNFSEINKELVEELKEAIAQNDHEEVHSILADLSENESKVAHHGRRAEQIVKSMLQHSRTSDGKRELTDLNLLCDEYVRLAYHGMRAKDKTFQSRFLLNLDPNLPRMEVVPQDIGRALLNLVNNAFQAVAGQKDGKVLVTSRKVDDAVELCVEDNGPGIPEDIMDKIFQPFFTTKPTGQGTGLGLSLSYDIVKTHGGEIKLDSQRDKGTTFVILLPNS